MGATDRQLLFGVLALQLEIISVEQFVEACTVWASRKDRPLPELLADRGWVKPDERADIEKLLARKIAKHGGDVAASLHDAAQDHHIRAAVLSIDDADLQRTIVPTPPPNGVAIVATRQLVPDGSERYTLSRLHATGGIGRVWLAHDVALRREVALKELRPERAANEAVMARFLREARVTGQLEHPGIVPIYEVGQRPDDKSPYYTMRFIRGQTLAEACADYHKRRRAGNAGPLELRKLLTAFIGVCNAVAYAHSRGVLHRDLKPQNIVLGGFGEVIVLDWGLARLSGDDSDSGPALDVGSSDGIDETRDGQALGTPAYMPPEQATGQHHLLGPAADVYGLGAVLYHILTDQPPFPGTNHEEIIRRVINDPPKPTRELVADIPHALDAVCLKSLSKKPEDRYRSAHELAEEIQHWLADEPVRAYADPLYVTIGRYMRRRKAFVSAAAVFLICAAVGSAGVSAFLFREQQAAKREQQTTERSLARTFRLLEDVMGAADQNLGRGLQDTMPARRTIMESAVAVMNDIRQERPNDELVAKNLAKLYTYVGTTRRIDRQAPGAEDALQKSIALLEPLVAKYKDDATYSTLLAQTYFQLGAIQRLAGRRRDALASHERSIQLSEAAAAKGDRDARLNLAIAVNEASIVQFGWKSMEITERTALRAVDLLNDIVAAKKLEDSILERRFLSGGLNRIAGCRRELGKPLDALPHLQKSADIIDAVTKRAPNDGNNIQFRAYCWLNFARVYAVAPGREADANMTFEKAIGLWKLLTERAPKLDLFALPLAQAYAERAQFLQRAGKSNEADADLNAAQKTLDALPEGSKGSPDYYTCRALMADVRTRLALDRKNAAETSKHLADALTAYQKLLELDPDNLLERTHFEKLDADVRAAGR